MVTRIFELATNIRMQVASLATKINMTYASGAWADYHPEEKKNVLGIKNSLCKASCCGILTNRNGD